MKKLNIISKIVVMLFVVLQVNSISAKTSNKSNIEELATKIIKSKSGINFMAVQSINALSFMASISRMTENERLITQQKFENFKNLTEQEFTPSLKEEFAILKGFKDYYSYQNLKSMSRTSFQVLVSDFPEINTISSFDKALLFQTIAEKFNYSIFSSPEFAADPSFLVCLGNSLAFFVSCIAPGASASSYAVWIGCMVVSETTETAATDGADQIIAPAVAAMDARVCAYLARFSAANVTICSEKFVERIDQCK